MFELKSEKRQRVVMLWFQTTKIFLLGNFLLKLQTKANVFFCFVSLYFSFPRNVEDFQKEKKIQIRPYIFTLIQKMTQVSRLFKLVPKFFIKFSIKDIWPFKGISGDFFPLFFLKYPHYPSFKAHNIISTVTTFNRSS